MTYQKVEKSVYYQMYEKIVSGAQTKYEEEIYIPILLELFAEGKDISAFCVRAEICRNTFYEWLKKHKRFAEAYEMAKELARHYHERLADVNADNQFFNITLWNLRMRNRFGYTSDRKVKISKLKKAKTPIEQLNVIKDEISEGNLTAAEVSHMGNFVLTGVKVDENTVMKKDVEDLKDIVLKDKR